MNKYKNNNFSRPPAGDSPMRFNKRPRYGTNNSGAGESLINYKNPKPSAYQYSLKRTNTSTDYPNTSNQYDKNSRHFYGISQKRPNRNHQQQNEQSSSYLRKSSASSLSPSSSTPAYGATTQNVLNIPPTQPDTTQQSAAQNNQQLSSTMLDSSNYYGFGYNNFYPTNYNAEFIANATTPGFSIGEGMSPYMWQTITSTPPPKLPPLLPPPLPPLPLQQPPSQVLPPLPNTETLPPSTSTSSLSLANSDPKINSQESAKTIVKMKTKRKAISTRYKLNRKWSEEDALLAVKAEESNVKKLQKDIILILHFPDPEISREIVKCYSPNIESVHFQLNVAPRSCLLHLKPGTNVDKTIDNLSKIPFGTGFLSVEIKQIPNRIHTTKLNEVDPFTLYVGNLPTTIACKTLKEHFPGAARIDIGFAQRMKYTRYAFVRYQSVEMAIEAYKRMLDAEIEGRTLTIRFRRITAVNESNKDGDVENVDNMHDDNLEQPLEDNSIKLSQKDSEQKDRVDNTKENNKDDLSRQTLNNLSNESGKETVVMEGNTAHNSDQRETPTESNPTATNYCMPPINSSTTTNSNQDTSNAPLLNIKPDPDIDPDDIVMRDNTITSRFEVTNGTIKQEEEEALYMEFFEQPKNQSEGSKENSKNSNNEDISSLPSTVDDTDTTSSISSNSLGEFLQNCQRSQTQKTANENASYAAKRITDSEDVRIKMETLEDNTVPIQNVPLFVSSVKQERVEEQPSSSKTSENLIHENSLNANETFSTRTKSLQASTSNSYANLENNQTNADNNDDMVPSTALFFANNNQNNLTNSSSISDYDEFYETRTKASSQPVTCGVYIKREPLNILTIRDTSETVKSPQNDSVTTAAINNAIDEDDLVPSQNLLGSYRPLQSAIKMEMEHDDIFSMPLKKANDINLDCDMENNDTTTIQTSQLNKGAGDKDHERDSDDDVVIVSENITRQAHQTSSNTLVFGNLFFRKQADLVTFKPKHIAASNSSRTSPKPIYHDNLDKLYEQLDADSDSDL